MQDDRPDPVAPAVAKQKGGRVAVGRERSTRTRPAVENGGKKVRVCDRCGARFHQEGAGRPRRFCYDCAPSLNSGDPLRKSKIMRTHRESNPDEYAAYNKARRKPRRGVYRSTLLGGKAEPRRKNAYSLDDFAAFCRQLKVDARGQPLKLEAFERQMLTPYFGGAVETVVIIPKKNGKTTLLAALALYHLDRQRDAECVIGAASRDQATTLLRQAIGLIRYSGFGDHFDAKEGIREIRIFDNLLAGRIRVLPADVTTTDGVIPTLALVDELHRHPSAHLYEMFRDGLGPRHGQMITISTAGASSLSPLGVLREKAMQLPSYQRDPSTKHATAESEDGSFVLHEWAMAPDEDPHDITQVAKANPASWQTVAALRRRHDSPSMTLGQWLRFACGVWTEAEDPWIEPQMWNDLAEDDLEIPEGSEVVVGVYAGLREQESGLVVLRPHDDVLDAKASIWPAAHKVTALEDEIERLSNVYSVGAVAYAPPLNFVRSAEVLEGKGLDLWDFPISQARMEDASADLLDIIEQKKIRHDGDAVFRAHVLSGVSRQTEHGWRLVRDPRRGSVSALIALLAAVYYRDKVTPKSYWEL